MILSKNNLSIFCLSIFLGLGAFDSPARAQPISHLKLDPNQAVWPRLSFQTPYFWVKVSTDIQMKSLRATDLDNELLAYPRGIPIKSKILQVNEMTINTIIAPRFRLSVRIHNRIWFNPADASVPGVHPSTSRRR